MLDRLSRENYIIENTLAKVADSVSPIFKGVKILSDGSVVKSGMNYSGKFQEAHDASKASIQSRILNLESGGVKGTGEGPVKVNYGEQYAREKRKKILKQNVEQVKKDIHIQQIVKGVLQVARVVFN
ncbi:hypothetical protein bcgnr5394_30870 [Bacillus cereus]|nr:hypothetical protein BCJMU10_3158 [Bacillus cereus]